MNLYTYVGNDPVNGADPTGMQSVYGEVHLRRRDIGNAGADRQNRAQAEGFMAGVRGIINDIRSDPVGAAADVLMIAADVATVPSGEGLLGIAARRSAREAGRAATRRAAIEAMRTCCFVAGTLVDTSEGLRPIEDLEVGDLVLSRDEATNETGYKPVTELIRRRQRQIWRLTFDVPSTDTASSEEAFGTTDDHPWRANESWVRTDELQVGMEILRADGVPARVTSITRTEEVTSTYNLEVADWHTYFVGGAGMWVHNSCPVPPRGRGAVPQSERDPRRVFTPAQRREALERQGGRCELCGEPRTADETVGHHRERHADGGPTTADNLDALCPECHIDLHRTQP